MPLYEYKCERCGLRFEELTNHKEAIVVPCKSCGMDSHRLISAFVHKVVNGSVNESVDMKIGREANKRWQMYHDNQTKRRGNRELKELNLPKSKDGEYMPVMGLGGKEDVTRRKEYVSALQEHQKQRQEKGLSQFSERGAF